MSDNSLSVVTGHGEQKNLHGHDDGGGQGADRTSVYLFNTTGHEVSTHIYWLCQPIQTVTGKCCMFLTVYYTYIDFSVYVNQSKLLQVNAAGF